MEFLPEEILEIIVNFCSLNAAKNLACTNSLMNRLTYKRIWRSPRFTNFLMSDLDTSKPIETLHTEDFVDWDLHSLKKIATLKQVHIYERFLNSEDLQLLQKVEMVIDANCLWDSDDSIDMDLLNDLKHRTNVKMVFQFCLLCPQWTSNELWLFADFKIKLLDISCVDSEACKYELMDFISYTQPERVELNDGFYKDFSQKDLAWLISNDVRLTHIDTDVLCTSDLLFKPFPWTVLAKNKYLRSIRFQFTDQIFLPQLRKFAIDKFKSVVQTNEAKGFFTDIYPAFQLLSSLKITKQLSEDCALVVEPFVIEFKR